MKKVALLLIVFFICHVAFSQVSVQVFGPDGETPFDNRDIMVGQKLTLKVISDSNDLWSGAFFIEGDDRLLGRLQAEDSDPNTRDCDQAHYPAAGDYAVAYKWDDSVIWGYDLYGDDVNCVAGDWYILDYYAQQPGECQVDFYDNTQFNHYNKNYFISNFCNIFT